MVNVAFAIVTTVFSIGFILLSKSEKNYNSLVKSSGEAFAQKVTKVLGTGGKCLLVFSVLWLIFLFLVD